MWAKLTAGCVAMVAVLVLAVRIANAIDEIHEGKVISISQDTITVLDRRDDDNDTFAVTGQTKITYNGKPAKLTDIQVGDHAKVTANEIGGKVVAKEISAVSRQ